MDYPKSDPTIGLVGGKFTDGNPGAGVAASRDPSSWANLVTDELLNVLTDAGIVPNEAIANQLAIAIQSGKLNIAADTGAANAYACTYAPAILALTDGLTVSFEAAHANTGASTLNINGIGAKPILGGAHLALQGGEIIAGGKIAARWSALLGAFVLVTQTGGATQVAAPTQSNHAVPLGQFPQSIASSGYIKLPGGLILQFGQAANIPAASASKVVTYPIAFPNGVLSVIAATLDGGATTTYRMNAALGSPASFQIINSYTAPIPLASWFAIGY